MPGNPRTPDAELPAHGRDAFIHLAVIATLYYEKRQRLGQYQRVRFRVFANTMHYAVR